MSGVTDESVAIRGQTGTDDSIKISDTKAGVNHPPAFPQAVMARLHGRVSFISRPNISSHTPTATVGLARPRAPLGPPQVLAAADCCFA